jgi:hypothetical protein
MIYGLTWKRGEEPELRIEMPTEDISKQKKRIQHILCLVFFALCKICARLASLRAMFQQLKSCHHAPLRVKVSIMYIVRMNYDL